MGKAKSCRAHGRETDAETSLSSSNFASAKAVPAAAVGMFLFYLGGGGGRKES